MVYVCMIEEILTSNCRFLLLVELLKLIIMATGGKKKVAIRKYRQYG